MSVQLNAQCTIGSCPDDYEGLTADDGASINSTTGDAADSTPAATTSNAAAEPAAAIASSHFARVKFQALVIVSAMLFMI